MKENKDTNKTAVKTVSMIIFLTFLSKILGLVRQMIMAAIYGGSMENTAFSVALNIPLDFFDVLFGAAILGVFIPVYNSFNFENNESKEEAEKFSNIFINTVLLAAGFLALLGIAFSKDIINIIAPVDDPETLELAANLLRIMFPMVIFTGAVYSLTGILQSKDEFLAPALVSAVSNLGVVLYFIFLNKYFGVYGLSLAYLISWIIQLITLVIPLIRKKYKYKFVINTENPALIRCLKTALPIMAGAWLIPLGKQIGLHFSALYENFNSVVASFTNSWQLFFIISGILTHAVCNYIFPKLAQNANDNEEFTKIVKTGLSASCFIIAPVACLAYVLRGEAVAVFFMRGEFTPELAALTAQMFSALAPSMIIFSVIEILNRVFYSKNLVKIPMFASLAGIIVNFIISWIFISKLNLPPVYITLAVFICQSVTAGILVISLNIKIKEIFNKSFLANIGKIVLSSGILLIIIKILYYIIKNSAFESGFAKNILVAGIIAVAGICAYIGAGAVLRTDEIKAFVKMLKKK